MSIKRPANYKPSPCPHTVGDKNPNGDGVVMEAFGLRTSRRTGRQENTDLRNERVSAMGGVRAVGLASAS